MSKSLHISSTFLYYLNKKSTWTASPTTHFVVGKKKRGRPFGQPRSYLPSSVCTSALQEEYQVHWLAKVLVD